MTVSRPSSYVAGPPADVSTAVILVPCTTIVALCSTLPVPSKRVEAWIRIGWFCADIPTDRLTAATTTRAFSRMSSPRFRRAAHYNPSEQSTKRTVVASKAERAAFAQCASASREGTGRDSLEPERARTRERERLGVGPQPTW